MSDKTSSKSLALLVTNTELIYLTKSVVDNDLFFSEPVKVALPDLTLKRDYQDIENVIKSNLPLLLFYHTIKICYLSSPVSIIPKYYSKENLEELLSFNDPNAIKAIKAPLQNIDANVVFNCYSPLDKVFDNLPNFNNSVKIHAANTIVNRTDLISEKNQIFARIINQNLELCVYKKKDFTFYNLYFISADEDIVYYILNLIEQLKLNSHDVHLIFEGGIDNEHIIIEELKKYINHIQIDESSKSNDLKFLLYKIFECE